MMQTSPETKELFAALAAAIQETPDPPKNAKNPHFGSMYAGLDSVLDSLRPALKANDIAVIQSPGHDGDKVTLTTRIVHTASGQYLEDTAGVPLSAGGKNAAQEAGSIITYLRRYSLVSLFALVADDDDDGNAAGKVANKTTSKPPTQEPMPQPDGEPSNRQKVLDLAKQIAEHTDCGYEEVLLGASNWIDEATGQPAVDSKGELRGFKDPFKKKWDKDAKRYMDNEFSISDKWINSTLGTLREQAKELGL